MANEPGSLFMLMSANADEDQYPTNGKGGSAFSDIADSHLSTAGHWSIDEIKLTAVGVGGTLTIKDSAGDTLFDFVIASTVAPLPFSIPFGPRGLFHNKAGGFTIRTTAAGCLAVVSYSFLRVAL